MLKSIKSNLAVPYTDAFYASPLVTYNSYDNEKICWKKDPNLKVQKTLIANDGNDFATYKQIANCEGQIYTQFKTDEVKCQACPADTFADIFQNACIAKSSFDPKNPFDYSRVLCEINNSVFDHIVSSFEIDVGLACRVVCEDGNSYRSYNCPTRIDFSDVNIGDYQINITQGSGGFGGIKQFAIPIGLFYNFCYKLN